MSDDAEESTSPPVEKRSKKKRRRARPQQPEAAGHDGPESAPPDPPAPEDEERIPAFARSFPRDAELDTLVAAFEAGDYARVRREAPALARRTEDDAVRRAARELRRRLDPDPGAVYMLLAAATLLVFLAGWYWLHPHLP